MISFGYAHLLRRFDGPTYQDPSAEALIFRERRFTYADLRDRASRLADALARLGVRRGDRVAILLRNDPAWIDTFFALSALGAVLVPVNYMLAAKEIGFILHDAGATTLIVGDDLAATAELALREVPELHRWLVVANAGGVDGPGAGALPGAEDFAECARSGEPSFPDVELRPDDPALLQYTSGTTGFPKGATHTISSLLWNSFHQIVDFGITARERYLCVPALCWVAGLHDFTLATLWTGGTVVLNPSGGVSVAGLLETVARQRITSALLVPTLLKQLVEYDGIAAHDLRSLRFALTGAEPVPVAAIEAFNRVLPDVTLVQGYGMSEGPTIATYLRPEDAIRKVGSCGKPSTNTELRVVDALDRPAPPGEVGEVVMRSPATMQGYWGLPTETKEALRGGWLHTGDLGVLDVEGFLTITGRKKDMYISGGLNVYPAEIEAVLGRHPDVAECAVFGVPDERWGESGVAVVVPGGFSALEPSVLLELCRAHLASYKVPRAIHVTATPLPRTASGKVQKQRLRDRLAELARG